MEELIPIGIVFGICTVQIVLLVVWVWMLIECVQRETDVDNQRLIWAIVVAAAGPLGALVYLFVRRPRRIRELGW